MFLVHSCKDKKFYVISNKNPRGRIREVTSQVADDLKKLGIKMFYVDLFIPEDFMEDL